jgi:hypothetical protein
VKNIKVGIQANYLHTINCGLFFQLLGGRIEESVRSDSTGWDALDKGDGRRGCGYGERRV